MFRCAKIVMLMFVCNFKRDGMRPTPVSTEIIPFSLDFVVISFIDHSIIGLKVCSLDPLPSLLMKNCVDLLLPIVTNII